MRQSIDKLIEGHRIRGCVVRAALGQDRLDVDLVRSAFWDDATVRFGGWAEWSPTEFVEAWAAAAERCLGTQHYVFNHSLEMDGASAQMETYYIAVFVVASTPAERALLPFCGGIGASEVGFQGGRYVDRLERRDGEWRVARRQVCGDWYATADADASAALHDAIAGTSPRRDRQDPSYAWATVVGDGDPLEELLAVDGIRDCVYRYARGIDRLDRETLASALLSLDDESLFTQEHIAPTHAQYITNLSTDVHGATAHAEAYFLSASSDTGGPDPAGGSNQEVPRTVELTGGRYVFELTDTAAGWRISARTVCIDWQASGDGSHIPAFLQATGNKSKRSRDDASYDPLVTDGVSRTFDDLVQREGVRACLARYARGVDRLDRELIASAFVSVAPQFVDYIFRQADFRPVQNHYWTNLRIQLQGDTAYIEAYYMCVIAYRDDTPSPLAVGILSKDGVHLVGGRYVVRLARGGDMRWRMEDRGNVGDWYAVIRGLELASYLLTTTNATQPLSMRSSNDRSQDGV